MEAKLLHSLVTKPPLPTALTLTKHSTTVNYPILSPSRRKQLKFSPINSSSSNTDESSVTDSNSLPQPQITPPPETVEVRFRRRSKRRSRQQRDDDNGDRRLAKAAEKAPVQKKKCEDMSAAEKIMELYMGEKGLLFWLNKFAYASIFIIIGGWILFRFVGPTLNLYQLDSPPLSPDSMFKGSS